MYWLLCLVTSAAWLGLGLFVCCGVMVGVHLWLVVGSDFGLIVGFGMWVWYVNSVALFLFFCYFRYVTIDGCCV